MQSEHKNFSVFWLEIQTSRRIQRGYLNVSANHRCILTRCNTRTWLLNNVCYVLLEPSNGAISSSSSADCDLQKRTTASFYSGDLLGDQRHALSGGYKHSGCQAGCFSCLMIGDHLRYQGKVKVYLIPVGDGPQCHQLRSDYNLIKWLRAEERHVLTSCLYPVYPSF